MENLENKPVTEQEQDKEQKVPLSRFNEIYAKMKTLEETVTKIQAEKDAEVAKLAKEKEEKEKQIEEEKKKSMSSTELIQLELNRVKLDLLKEKITKQNPDLEDVLTDIKVSSEDELLKIIEPLLKFKEKTTSNIETEAQKKAKLLIEQAKATVKGEKQTTTGFDEFKRKAKEAGWL